MNLPSGLIFFLDFKYGSAQGGSNQFNGKSLFGGTNITGSADNFGRTNQAVGGLYGEGRYGYSVNDLNSVHAGTFASSSATWTDIGYDTAVSASATTKLFKVTLDIASGSTNTVLALADFAKAKYALDKAQAGGARVAIIDPSQEYVFNTLVGAQAFTNNPAFEGIVQGGFVNEVTGMRFIRNIFGFDVYVSNFLPAATEAASSSLGGVTVPATPTVNMFMSVGGDLTPFVGAYRQMPRVEYERNKDLRRDEYVMNARFGLKLYRPECLVSVITKNTI
jgi:hypothetical protein